MPDTLVVGGGIVGCSVALALLRDGHSVDLIDPGAAHPEHIPFGESFTGPASFGNAGHIATEQTKPLADPSFVLSAPGRLFRFGGALDLGWTRPGAWLPWSLLLLRASTRAAAGTQALSLLLSDALPAWQRLARMLGEPDLVRDAGHLMLWRDPSALRHGVSDWCGAPTGTARTSPLDRATLDAVAHRLNRSFAGGVRFENTGQVADPARCVRLLEQAFRSGGGRIVRQRVTRLRDDTSLVLADGETRAAGRIVLAAGVATGRLLRGLGRRLPLVAERGYHLEWRHGTDWPFPPLVFAERSLIVSRFGDRLRASSFVEFDREDAPPDGRKWQRLGQHVTALGLPVASPFRRWMGARPTLPDYLPAIGAVPGLPNLLVATGHGHLGLTLAPRTAEILVRLARGEACADLAPFAPARFDRPWRRR